MYSNQNVIWLFVGISSVLVSRTISQRWTTVLCNDRKTQCPYYSSCQWTGSAYYCACSSGFIWNGRQCRVLCSDWKTQCPYYSSCQWTGSAHYCACFSGYRWRGGQCRVQCSYPNPSCPPNAVCSQKWKYCICSVGYTWREGQCKVYCGEGQSCPTDSTCKDKYYCECDHGYIWWNSECKDWDECDLSHPCHQNAECVNTAGSYYCTCKSGYTGNGRICTDIDECSNRIPCDRSAVCENYPGGYNCTCLTGYSGNGTICTDIDECSDPSVCHRDAVCENYHGGYNCTCIIGYAGNGTLCTDTQNTGIAALTASLGIIAGGVIGPCAVLIAVVVLVSILAKRRKKEKSEVSVHKSPPQPQNENIPVSSNVSVTGNLPAVVSHDVDGSHEEVYHNSLIKERKKIQLNQTPEKSDDNMDINFTNDVIYTDDNSGEFRGSLYNKLRETKTEQPPPNFAEERSSCDVQVNVTTDVEISNSDGLYGYDHLKRGASQPHDNTGHDQEGEAYGHLYGRDISNWVNENTDIDDEQWTVNNVYSTANDVCRD